MPASPSGSLHASTRQPSQQGRLISPSNFCVGVFPIKFKVPQDRRKLTISTSICNLFRQRVQLKRRLVPLRLQTRQDLPQQHRTRLAGLGSPSIGKSGRCASLLLEERLDFLGRHVVCICQEIAPSLLLTDLRWSRQVAQSTPSEIPECLVQWLRLGAAADPKQNERSEYQNRTMQPCVETQILALVSGVLRKAEISSFFCACLRFRAQLLHRVVTKRIGSVVKPAGERTECGLS